MKTIIITGGNSGLGFETAKLVAKKGGDYSIYESSELLYSLENARELWNASVRLSKDLTTLRNRVYNIPSIKSHTPIMWRRGRVVEGG
ncbi:MAG: hypothetical protein IJ697_09140 [Synergistaceae bacterium]|nr:hypothetical protein [Synergistaceae bacterium]